MVVKGRILQGEHKASRYYNVPTANVQLPAHLELPYAVYTGMATLADGSVHPCVICYSMRGAHAHPKFEAHLFGWSGDLYDQEVSVEVKEKVSDLAPFTGEEAMKKKVLSDVACAKEMLGLA